MEQTYNIWLTMGGLGLMIYGITLMETVIKKLVKSSIQEKLASYTKNKRNSFLLGVGATGLTQSSSLVGLLLLVFVGAGIIGLTSAMGVIAGANIGTTFSSLIIAVLGFGSFSITAFAFPLIAVGGVSLLFVTNEKYRYYLKLMMSLGLIFFGIDLIKDSVEALKTIVDFSNYAHLGIIGFFVIGVILTGIIQSSHTVVIMTLAALHGGIITFPMALGIVIGSNIGTTVTILLASLGGSLDKRKVAMGHLGFNLLLSIIGLLYYPYITLFITDVLRITNNPMIIITVFNLILNTITALILLPFLEEFVGYIRRFSANTDDEKTPLHVSMLQGAQDLHSKDFPGVSMFAIILDCKVLFHISSRYIIQLFEEDILKKQVAEEEFKTIKDTTLYKFIVTLFQSNNNTHETKDKKVLLHKVHTEKVIIPKPYNETNHEELYTENKRNIELIFPILLEVNKQELSKSEHIKQNELQVVLHNIIEAMKYSKAIITDMETLREQENTLEDYYKNRKTMIHDFLKAFISMIDTKRGSDKEFRKQYDQQKSLYKKYHHESESLLEKVKPPKGFAMSTLYNIENHLLSIQKSLLKARKAYGNATEHSSKITYSSFVEEVYDEGQPALK